MDFASPANVRGKGDIRGPLERHLRALQDAIRPLQTWGQAYSSSNRTFTNTSFLDLDALTGGSGTLPALAVTLETGSQIKVTISANLSNANLGAFAVLGYRISGATTAAANDEFSLFYESSAASDQIQNSWVSTRLITPGLNTFELQARSTAGTAFLRRATLLIELLS
jgi:hypothetical protein